MGFWMREVGDRIWEDCCWLLNADWAMNHPRQVGRGVLTAPRPFVVVQQVRRRGEDTQPYLPRVVHGPNVRSIANNNPPVSDPPLPASRIPLRISCYFDLEKRKGASRLRDLRPPVNGHPPPANVFRYGLRTRKKRGLELLSICTVASTRFSSTRTCAEEGCQLDPSRRSSDSSS